MCDVSSAIMAVIGIAGTAYSAHEQDKADKRFNQQAEENYNVQVAQMQAKREQTADVSADEQSDIAKQTRAEMARIATIAGESGAMGGVYDRLMLESQSAGDDAIAQSKENLANGFVQSQQEAEGLRSAAKAGSRTGANWTGVGLQIAGQAAQGYASSRKAQDARTYGASNVNANSVR